ncbi:5'-3' exonuclease [Scopulibacillus darangshiensis]|uniref:5'-3' exonuclease n=1 Tax=Scopulibacillus darangshiensis TaxID=442528 RepID=A0A4R2P914_9BACL|nr:5'-3' exonuclease H3TH domain-containing protein [Scopulibacillus darangshiensis]TCP30551.1 5'-3' exonuclease [Scopulibacillus darangshiensis]
MQKLMLIDGMALLFRGYFATAYRGSIRRTELGVPTNGVHWLIRYMWQAMKVVNPTHIICCWDTEKPTFRKEMFDQYKANRSAPPEDLIPQFQLARDVVESIGIANVSLEGYEADDVMGTIAKTYSKAMEVDILTGDHDTLQLVDDNIHVIIMEKGFGNFKRYTSEVLFEEKGLTAEQIVDLKALMGDRSDNYPGVPGIGEKTALKLLHDFGNVNDILKNQSVLSKGVRGKLEKGIEMLALSKELATIACNAPVKIELEKAVWHMDVKRVNDMFDIVEFKSLLGELHEVHQSIQEAHIRIATGRKVN